MKDMDNDMVVLYEARVSRVKNHDANDACIVGMLLDPKEDIRKKVHAMIGKFTDSDLRALGVARQEVLEMSKESVDAP
ncbi:hypothetical protein B296_00023950 [Ensete ventricosum]|uniref:Uncharacterized protein n=1 Tax=Ensete ventricosum TaxID=4639 RepID=A0A426YS61_ENSVE|nr:hypothetical protein B296_00023950 [Ensete ventricosum]